MKHARFFSFLASVLDGVNNAVAFGLPRKAARYLGIFPHTVQLPPGGKGNNVPVQIGPIRLLLDPQDVYSVDLPLPRGIGANPWLQAQILAHRYMPLKPSLLTWDLVVLRQEGRRMARVSMVRRSILDAAQRNNVGVSEITLDGSGPQPQFLRLHPQRLRQQGLRILVLLAVPILVVPMPLIVGTWILDQQTNHMEQKLRSLASDINDVRNLQDRRNALENSLDYSNHIILEPTRTQVLDEVSYILPDDSWLRDLELNPDGLFLKGQSTDSGNVLARFRDDPLFVDAHLLTNDTAGSFSLTASLQAPGNRAGSSTEHRNASPTDIAPEKGAP